MQESDQNTFKDTRILDLSKEAKTTPQTEVAKVLTFLRENLQPFEEDLGRREIDLQLDEREVRTSASNYDTKGGEIEGISDEALAILKNKLGIDEEKVELVEDPNDGQGDLRANDIKRYKTNVPYLALEEWVYDEAWYGRSSGVKLVLDPNFGEETVGENTELKLDLEKIRQTREKQIQAEVKSILSQLKNDIETSKPEEEFEILLWKDRTYERVNTGDYQVRNEGRIGISPEAEARLLRELEANESETIDCSDSEEVAYEVGSPTRVERYYTPTKYPNVYVYKEIADGGWHGHSEKAMLVRVNQLPSTLEENENTYPNNN